jgi:RNA polymerase sigma factor (sigma-70 family)
MSSRTIPIELTASIPAPANWEDTSFAPAREQATAAFLRFREPVYRYIVNAHRNPAEAEEIAQEAFLRLFRALCRGERIHNIQVWVFTVARNHAISLARKRRRFSFPFAKPQDRQDKEDSLGPSFVDPSPTPEQNLIEQSESEVRRRRASRIVTAMATLTDRQRECFHLRCEGLTYREIAETLHISIYGAVDGCERAIKNLRKNVDA